jgi:hypothetical protein
MYHIHAYSGSIKNMSRRTGPLHVERAFARLFKLSLALPMVGKMDPDHREGQPKGYTSHEVTAPRAVGPSGRTQS